MVSSQSSETAEISIDIMRYVKLVLAYSGRIIAFGVVVSLLTYLVLSTIKPQYEATSTLLIEQSQILSIEEVYSGFGRSSDYLLTQFEILKSRDLSRRVTEKLGLVDSTEFNPFKSSGEKSFSFREYLSGESAPVPTAADEFEETVNRVWEAIQVRPVLRTQLVNITVTSINPSLAANVANAVGEAYIEIQLETKSGVNKDASAWLSKRLVGMKATLESSEGKLQAFREENNLIELPDSSLGSLVSQEIQSISTELSEARSRRLDLETTSKQIKAMGTASLDRVSTIPAFLQNGSTNSLFEKVVSADLRVNELSKRYGVKHPKMISAQSELNSSLTALDDHFSRLSKGLESEYQAALNKEKALDALLVQKKDEIRRINRAEFQLNEYKREVSANQQIYDTFFSRIRETTETSDLGAATVRLTDPALTPKYPVKPKKGMITVAAFIISSGLMAAVIILLEVLNSTIKNASDVTRKLGASVLGIVPLYKSAASSDPDDKLLVRAFSDEAAPGFAESIRSLRTNITLAGLEHPVKTILVTSTVPGEGKTTTSANLAEAYGQVEKTLLIDADMRKPSLARKVALPFNSKGLSNAVAYPDQLDECIHHIPELGVDIMPSGPLPPNPLELLGSPNFESILHVLSDRYDRIIIDSAPTKLVSDGVLLSTLVDAVIYVVNADSTRDGVIKGSLQRLSACNARVLGIVLNQLDFEKEIKYGGVDSEYYADYSQGYGYLSSKNS
ncbi:GumC family protein [Oceanobacter antarcticus]|uniref:non-specific protein-tyrosine kinase n=1 Tax=Oceanobacter antarcticus TaxID=3133425 RepID=A0ABW8NI40_9GAMM